MASFPLRAATAALIFKAGIFLSQAAGDLLPYSRSHAGRLGIGMLEIALEFATIALAIAWLLPGRASLRLGLAPGRLPWSAVLALVIGTLGLSHAIEGVFAMMRVDEGTVMQGIARSQRAARGGGLWLAVIGSVLAPSIAEELLCRGLIQRTLARWIAPGIAVLVATAIFGWLHHDWTHGSVAALIGLYLGTIAWWADSTRPAILAHGANNLLALLGSAGLVSLRAPVLISAPVGAALAIAALLWAARFRHRGAPRGGPGPLLPPYR